MLDHLVNADLRQEDDDLEGDEEELELAGREWKRMEERSMREGFRSGYGFCSCSEEDLYLCREGRSTAEEAALQEGFDIGYKQGFTWAKSVGKLRGRLAAKRVVLKDSGSDMELQLEELARRVEQLKYGDSTSELEHRLDQLD